MRWDIHRSEWALALGPQVRYIAVLVAAVIAMYPACAAPSSGLSKDKQMDVTARVGVSKGALLYRFNHWWPVVVTIRDADRDFAGYVEITPNKAKLGKDEILRHVTRYRRRLTLTKGSAKRLVVPVFFADHVPEWQMDIVSDSGDNLLPISMPVLGSPMERDQLVLAVAERQGLDPFFRKISKARYHRARGPGRRVVYADPRIMPNDALLLSGYDCIVLDNIAAGYLDDVAIEALADYCAAGRTLIVTGGSHATWLNRSPLASILPVRVHGHKKLPSTAEVAAALGLRTQDAAPMTVVAATATRGTVLAANGGLPLLVAAPHGRGEIVFFAFSLNHPATRSWVGQRALGDRFCRNRPVSLLDPVFWMKRDQYEFWDRHELSRFRDGLLSHMESSPLIKAIPRPQVGWFLAIYLAVLSPFAYLFFKKQDRLEWAWAACPVLAVSFAAVPFVGEFGKGGSSVSVAEMRVVETASGMETGLATSIFVIYSPTEGKYDVQFGDRRPLVCDAHSKEGDMPRLEALEVDVTYGRQTTVDKLSVLRQSLRSFGAWDQIALGEGIEARLSGDRLQIRNECGLDLEDVCYFGRNRHVAATIGSVEDGDEIDAKWPWRAHDEVAKQFAEGEPLSPACLFLADVVAQAARGENRPVALTEQGYLIGRCSQFSDITVNGSPAEVHGQCVVIVAVRNAE